MPLRVMPPGWAHRRELDQVPAAESTSAGSRESWDPGLGWHGYSCPPSAEGSFPPAPKGTAQALGTARALLPAGAAPSAPTPGHQMAPIQGCQPGTCF